MSALEPRVMVLCCPGLCWPGGTTPPNPPGLCWPGGRPPKPPRAVLARGTTPKPPRAVLARGDDPPKPPGLAGPRTARGFDQVLTAVTAFCPAVEAVEPGVCAFGTRGPARYFGGETALAGRITAAVADLGVESRAGVADGLFAAHLAARGGRPVLVIPPGRTPEFLARQPVSVLAGQDAAGNLAGQGAAGNLAGRDAAGDLAGQDLAALLSRLGLHTLGDLAALPPDDVASRFGAAGETAHRLARGLGSRPLAVRPPAEDLSVAQEFDPPEPLAEPVVFAAKALAERMHEGLAARGLTCVRVQVRAACADGRESRRLWRHDGLLSAAALADRVRWQLDGWRVPAADADGPPGDPTDGTADGTAIAPPTGASRRCGWCRTRWSTPPGTSSRSGGRPWSATGWRGPPCGCRPCSGTRPCCARPWAAAGTWPSR